MRQEFFSFKTLIFAVLVLFGAGYMPQALAIQEVEPNDECTSAQDLGAAALPLTIDGTITADETSNFFDADYFKVSGTPGDTIKVVFKEDASVVPFFVLGSSCNLISDVTFNGDIKVPDDGVVIFAASFTGSSAGIFPYQMSVSHYDPYVGTISGRVVNQSDTVFVNLIRCEVECINVASTGTDSQGNFSFTGPVGFPAPIEAGTFQVFVDAQVKPGTTNPTEKFTLAANENKDIGVIELNLPAFIGSISGRVVDAVSGAPLSGTAEPFAKVTLSACSSPTSCTQPLSVVDADSQGQFKFTVANSVFGGGVSRLRPGLYAIKQVIANQYDKVIEADTVPFNVLKDENRNIGDIHVQSLPVRFSNNTPCTKPSPDSSSCVFSVTMTNGLATPFNGDTWSIIDAITGSSGTNFTSFQINTERLALKVGQSRTVKFAMPLPTASVPNNVNICADAYVGTRPNAVWNVVGHTTAFCMRKTAIGLIQNPAKEAFELSNHLK